MPKNYIYGGVTPPKHRRTDSVNLANKRIKQPRTFNKNLNLIINMSGPFSFF